MDPRKPGTDRLLLQLAGGGWEVADWSPDDSQLLLQEYVSINESYLWLVDIATGEKRLLTPRGGAPVAYGDARFARDGRSLWVTADRDAEFKHLASIDLATGRYQDVTASLRWDVSAFDISRDGRRIVFLVNEAGVSRLHLLDTATRKELAVPQLPVGAILGAALPPERPRHRPELRRLAHARRRLLAGHAQRQDRTLDRERAGWRRSRAAGRAAAGALEELRRPRDHRLPHPATGALHGQAAGGDQHPRRARRPGAAHLPGPRQLLHQRAGRGRHPSQRARLHRLRQDLRRAGQRLQARGLVQGHRRAARLDRDPARPGRFTRDGHRRQLRRAHGLGCRIVVRRPLASRAAAWWACRTW